MAKDQPNLDPKLVAERAYELFERRGKQPGHEVDDWLQAENELRQSGGVMPGVKPGPTMVKQPTPRR